MAGLSEYAALNKISEARGIEYCCIWWQREADRINQFRTLMSCLSSGGNARFVEVRSIEHTASENLV